MKPTMYRICVRGRLTERLDDAFEGMRVEAGGACTAITGRVRDQSELYGLLDRVSDLGLELISAQPLTSPALHSMNGDPVSASVTAQIDDWLTSTIGC